MDIREPSQSRQRGANVEKGIIYHGSQEIVQEPVIKITKYHKDFYYGFYCTIMKEQAERWAVRYNGHGIINEYTFRPDASLRVFQFTEMTETGLDFIVACRLGKSHDYDIVEGPMANDTIFNYVQNFVDEKISREAFWTLVRFNKPTHQISFHTAKALTSLQFIKGYEVYDDEE